MIPLEYTAKNAARFMDSVSEYYKKVEHILEAVKRKLSWKNNKKNTL